MKPKQPLVDIHSRASTLGAYILREYYHIQVHEVFSSYHKPSAFKIVCIGFQFVPIHQTIGCRKAYQYHIWHYHIFDNLRVL